MSSFGTSVFSLLPSVLEEVLGAEAVTSAMGIQSVWQFFGFISSTPIVGESREHNSGKQIVSRHQAWW